MKHKIHPNSLKNLTNTWNSESAREAQKNSVESRRTNAEARAKLKLTAKEWERYKKEVLSDSAVTSIDILKILMLKALEKNDFDTAADLAKTLAEFDAPKLARVDQTNLDVKTEELTDEELENKLRSLGIERNSDGDNTDNIPEE